MCRKGDHKKFDEAARDEIYFFFRAQMVVVVIACGITAPNLRHTFIIYDTQAFASRNKGGKTLCIHYNDDTHTQHPSQK